MIFAFILANYFDNLRKKTFPKEKEKSVVLSPKTKRIAQNQSLFPCAIFRHLAQNGGLGPLEHSLQPNESSLVRQRIIHRVSRNHPLPDNWTSLALHEKMNGKTGERPLRVRAAQKGDCFSMEWTGFLLPEQG